MILAAHPVRSKQPPAIAKQADTGLDMPGRIDVTCRVLLSFLARKQVVAVSENVKAREEVFRQAQEFFNQGIRAGGRSQAKQIILLLIEF